MMEHGRHVSVPKFGEWSDSSDHYSTQEYSFLFDQMRVHRMKGSQVSSNRMEPGSISLEKWAGDSNEEYWKSIERTERYYDDYQEEDYAHFHKKDRIETVCNDLSRIKLHDCSLDTNERFSNSRTCYCEDCGFPESNKSSIYDNPFSGFSNSSHYKDASYTKRNVHSQSRNSTSKDYDNDSQTAFKRPAYKASAITFSGFLFPQPKYTEEDYPSKRDNVTAYPLPEPPKDFSFGGSHRVPGSVSSSSARTDFFESSDPSSNSASTSTQDGKSGEYPSVLNPSNYTPSQNPSFNPGFNPSFTTLSASGASRPKKKIHHHSKSDIPTVPIFDLALHPKTKSNDTTPSLTPPGSPPLDEKQEKEKEKVSLLKEKPKKWEERVEIIRKAQIEIWQEYYPNDLDIPDSVLSIRKRDGIAKSSMEKSNSNSTSNSRSRRISGEMRKIAPTDTPESIKSKSRGKSPLRQLLLRKPSKNSNAGICTCITPNVKD